MHISSIIAAIVVAVPYASANEVEAPISARTSDIESDWSAVYYGRSPLLIGNDGSAGSGGFRAWDLNSGTPMSEIIKKSPGRTKLVTSVYEVDDKDYLVTIDQPESHLKLYDFDQLDRREKASKKVLGDWSAICPWKSKAGNQYVFLFGKKQAIQFLLRDGENDLEIIEIQTFETPVEASSCAVLPDAVYFAGDDNKAIYSFNARESTAKPLITVLGEAEDDVTGLASYSGKTAKDDYLLVAQENVISVFSRSFVSLGNIKLTGDEDIEVQGLNVYQRKTSKYPAGVLTFAIESDSATGFGVAAIEDSFEALGLKLNLDYYPSKKLSRDVSRTICDDCDGNGFCSTHSKRYSGGSCDCFAGFTGRECKKFTCRNDCSGHGKCVGANECKCDAGWGGLYCAFLLVGPKAETAANGGDGDDPAIWIAPGNTANSRIITTTKSEVGAGLGVFDLTGSLLQTIPAGEPNNVDIIYGFQAGNRTVDLAYAACREDNTLW
jgi:3-phytase